jgi:hypothetical protein
MTSDDVFPAIRALINRYDPEDLLDIAPEDEYDPEVRDLLELVNSDQQITESAVSTCWLNRFGASDWPTDQPDEVTALAAGLNQIRRELRTPQPAPE